MNRLPVIQDEAEGAAETFKALGDPTRIKLLGQLRSRGACGPDTGLCVCDLTGTLGVGQSTISHHLALLRRAGLVAFAKRGQYSHFWIAPRARETILDLVEGVGL
jgi:ArsR family transcriptional regulator